MERRHLSHCAYCHNELELDTSTCDHCGMPVPLKRVRTFFGVELNFKVFVILLAIACLILALILPRNIIT